MPNNSFSEQELRDRLTEEQYKVTQEAHTELPGTGEYDQFFEEGTYHCVVCGAPLFESDYKYDAGCGWPSFYDSKNKDNIDTQQDMSLGMVRDEITCKNCGAHLGHVFPDGPNPTGTRYCVNSAALRFEEE